MMTQALHNMIGHSAHPPEQPLVQSLHDHMAGVACRAAVFAEAFASSPFGAWLGWWHDAGKVSPAVQAYLRGETNEVKGPDHSSAGMLEAWPSLPFLASLIGGHHSGLADHADVRSRIERVSLDKRIVEAHALAQPLLNAQVRQPTSLDVPPFIRQGRPAEQKRRVAFWCRMLHSALVDADRLDTEAHWSPQAAALRVLAPPALEDLWSRLETAQASLLDKAPETRVNQIRAYIYEACLEAARQPAGFFSLTVPTGGGKTRSVLAFALCHALLHAQRRVVVALPFTTIIEQNAEVYRTLLGEGAVIEHHSAVQPRPPRTDEDPVELDRRLTLAAENWDAPVVVTTTVQLFESLFARANTRLRKLHRIAGSVIVLDEAQTLPPDLLIPTLEALRFLVEDYGCTVVFCTATQPAFDRPYGDPQFGPYFAGFNIREIIPDPQDIYENLRRVRYDVQTQQVWSWEEVAAEMRTSPQALAVVNTIADAHRLYTCVAQTVGNGDAFHLSTRQCGAHRRRVLGSVRRRLQENAPVSLVSTQVIEAGVDVSFPLVLRALGPLDSIIQAAGRCNREGENPDGGRVVVFRPETGSLPPGAYRAGTQQTEKLMAEAQQQGAPFAEMLHTPELSARYFAHLYPTQKLDAREILDRSRDQDFRTVAERYRFIEETVAVVVDYSEGGQAVQFPDAILDRIDQTGEVWRSDWRALQPFTVSLRHDLHEKAVSQGLCYEMAPGLWRWDGAYDGSLNGLGLQFASDTPGLIVG